MQSHRPDAAASRRRYQQLIDDRQQARDNQRAIAGLNAPPRSKTIWRWIAIAFAIALVAGIPAGLHMAGRL